MSEDKLMNTDDVATYIGASSKFVKALRLRGEGPPPIRIARNVVRYDRGSVDLWLATLEEGRFINE